MKNLSYLSLIVLIIFTACEPAAYSYIEVYNGFDEPVEFSLNDELHKINAKELLSFSNGERGQYFQFGQTKEFIKTNINEKILINLSLDTIVKEELLYGTGSSQSSASSGSVIASNLIKLRGKKYFGPYELSLIHI